MCSNFIRLQKQFLLNIPNSRKVFCVIIFQQEFIKIEKSVKISLLMTVQWID